MTRTEVLKVKPETKIKIWVYKKKHGFKTMAEALDDMVKKAKEKNKQPS